VKPIEVRLRQRNIAVSCLVRHEDGTSEQLDVKSLDMRGAQREVTSRFKREGHHPVGRWTYDRDSRPFGSDAIRRFSGR
jgi:hypothetical protein